MTSLDPTAPPGRGAPASAAPESPVNARADAPAESASERLVDPLAQRRVLALRHPWRWLAVAAVLVLVAQIVHGLATNAEFRWGRFAYWFGRPVVLDGLSITLQVTAWSAVFGFVGGVLLALMRLSRNPVLRAASWIYIWLFRSIPLIVLLVLLYNFALIYPRLSLGIPFGPHVAGYSTATVLSAMTMAVVGLSLNEAAYAAEVVRGGILSVDPGQREAAAVLGLSRWRELRRVVLPQALRAIVPSYVNQLIGLIKASSLVFYVSLLDIFGAVQTLENTYTADIVPLLMVASAWYILLTSVLSVVQFYVERYFARGAVRTISPTPLQRLRRSATELRARLATETAT